MKLSRRQLARLLLTTAPALAIPPIAMDHPIWRHLGDLTITDAAESELASPNWSAKFLTRSQEISLRVLSEVMVPGSTAAQVSQFIDLLLSVDTTVVQQKFLGSLLAFEEAAQKSFGQPLSKLSDPELQRLLTPASTATHSGDADAALRGHFEDLKEWISGAYYSSEAGMRELGWTPDRVFPTYPVCSHSEGHS